MTPEETAAALKKPNGDAGFAFMADPLTREGGKAVGLRGRPLYHCGRGGALGDVPAEVVIAAFAFFPPEVVRTHWEAGRQVMPPPEAALLYARYLVDSGLAEPGRLRLATRGGIKEVDVEHTGDVTVDMGKAVVGEPVDIDGVAATFVDMGNPHAVLPVASVAALGVLDPDRKDLNVEYVEDVDATHIRMRVHERGVGETRSCGTGACAAVVATVLRTGGPRDTSYTVDVPGGRLAVTWCADGRVLLAGPAVLVAEGELRADWLETT